MLLLIVVLAWLAGLLVTQKWWPGATRSPGEQSAAEVSPLPIPVLKPDLDPTYRELMEEAVEAGHQLLESYPEDPEVVAVIAMLHHFAHDKAAEELCWQRCLELDSGFSRAYQWLGERSTDDGDYEKAETLMRQALAAGCKQPEFPFTLGTALMRQGKLEEAVRVLEDDLQTNPQLAKSRILLGQVYLQLKKNEEAKRQFETVLLLNSSSPPAYLGLATACDRLGLKDDAEKCRAEFKRIKRVEVQVEQEKQRGRKDELMAPRWVAEIMTMTGRIYLAHERLEDAERCLLRAVELDPNDTNCREALTALYVQQGRHADALPVVKNLRDLQPWNPNHLKSLGLLHGRLGQLAMAEETFQELCRLAPEKAVGYAGLAEIYLRLDKSIPEAKALASKAVSLDPTAWNYFILAAICDKDGDIAGASAAMERAKSLEPGNPLFQKIREAAPQRP